MAIRLSHDFKDLDVDKYFRIQFVTEERELIDGSYVEKVAQKYNSTLCTRDMFKVTNSEWEIYGLSKSYCPDIQEQVKVQGQWSSRKA